MNKNNIDELLVRIARSSENNERLLGLILDELRDSNGKIRESINSPMTQVSIFNADLAVRDELQRLA